MVENKHSINTILSFGAKSVNPEILENLLTGRKKAADHLENNVKTIVKNNDNQFILVIGQRGMGKTHLLKVLHTRILHYSYENKLKIAYFAEEEYGVANFFDFLLRILNSFIKWYETDEEFLKSELENLQNTSLINQENYLKKIINDFVDKKPLLILTENFGDILDQMGIEEQGRLRAWLYENTNVSIIASSQSVSEDFDKEDRPFYGFFTPYYLKNLSFEESYSFLISLAEIEQNDELVQHLKTKGKPQVRAIYDLVKGNHRLLVTFYHFLKTDMLAKVSENFIKTINDLKPYYETYIRYLPAQQQKILRYIALSRKPQLGIEIAKNCFIEQKTLSKQLSELSRKKLVEAIPDPSDKRNKFYDINEPLLRISIEVGEHKEGITALFIDFLALYYNIEELVKRKSKFELLAGFCDTEKEKKEINYEVIAIEKALDRKKDFYKNEFPKKLSTLLSNKRYDEVIQLINECNIREKLMFIDKNLIILPIANIVYKNEGALRAFKYFSQIEGEINDVFENKNYQSVIFISKEEFIYQFAVSNIVYGEEKNNSTTLKLGINTLEGIIDIEEKYKLLYLFASLMLIEKEKKSNPEQLNRINFIYKRLLDIDLKGLNNDETDVYYSLFLMIISFLSDNNINQELKNEVEQNFLNQVNNSETEKKLAIIKLFLPIGDFWVWSTFKDYISDNIIEFSESISSSVNNLLTEKLTEKQIFEIKDFVEKNIEYISDLKISEIYINTYQQVILNKNEAALYELPKEQREFFEKNILKRK